MLDTLLNYYHQLLVAPQALSTPWDVVKAFVAIIALGILVTGLIALIAAFIIRRTHREEIAALMRSRLSWAWAFAVCAAVQFSDIAYLWHRDALVSFAAAVPLLSNVVALSLLGLAFYLQVRIELRRFQQILKATNEAR